MGNGHNIEMMIQNLIIFLRFKHFVEGVILLLKLKELHHFAQCRNFGFLSVLNQRRADCLIYVCVATSCTFLNGFCVKKHGGADATSVA